MMQYLSVNYSNKVWIEIKLLCTVSTELYYKTENDAKEGCQYSLVTTVLERKKYFSTLLNSVHFFIATW
jgi:hypothetical protein